MINFKPLADRVLIEPTPVEETTASGIIIPDAVKEKPNRGVVVAVGPGIKNYPLVVEVGDEIMYSKHSGVDLPLDGVDYLILRESEILAIL